VVHHSTGLHFDQNTSSSQNESVTCRSHWRIKVNQGLHSKATSMARNYLVMSVSNIPTRGWTAMLDLYTLKLDEWISTRARSSTSHMQVIHPPRAQGRTKRPSDTGNQDSQTQGHCCMWDDQFFLKNLQPDHKGFQGWVKH
jgi:hypothetical protein